MDFDAAFQQLLGHEGAYSNEPDDPGGETMWGITAVVAKEEGYTGYMRAMPVDFAKLVYRRRYWDAVKADSLPDGVRYNVFDAAVNSGPRQAIQWLQRAAGTADDGRIGAVTLAAAHQMGTDRLVLRFLAQRLRFMTDLRTWGAFGRGWAKRIADMMEG